MPIAPRRQCKISGCPHYAEIGSRCKAHAKQRERAYNANRVSARKLGYNARWEKAAKEYLRANPFCTHHMERGEFVMAREVDHVIPHRGDMGLFWDPENLQSLCKACHSAKTMREAVRKG